LDFVVKKSTRARMIATKEKALRNALFVDSTSSVIEKMAVMMRTTTEEKEGLKRWFCTFVSFLVWSICLQKKGVRIIVMTQREA
jgi:hypothetical protein